MRYFLSIWLLTVVIAATVVISSCATTPAGQVSDVDDFDSDLAESNETAAVDKSEGNELEFEEDLTAGSEKSSDSEQPSSDELDETANDDSVTQLKEDKFSSAEPDAPSPSEPAVGTVSPDVAAPQAAGAPLDITALEFRANEGGGTIVVTTNGKATFTTRVNAENQQFIVEVQNARLPGKFKRPYNTKEFPGPIAGIQAYQSPGAKVARIVVQLKEPIEPVVRQVGHSIMISPSEENLPVAEVEAGIGAGEEVEETGPSALSSNTLDEFLLGQSKFYGRKISIQFREAEIRDVFNFISEESGLNIVLTDDVVGKVSLKLRQVPWDQALIIVMRSKQLGYVRQGNVLRISPLSALQKEANDARSVMESQSKLRPLRIKVFPVSYAKVGELEGQAKEFLSDRGKAKGDSRTNSLIVNDLEENIERVAKLVEILDTETPQVLIEAKIIEARQDFQRRVGLRWTLQNANLPMGNFNGTPLSTKPTLNMSATAAAPINAQLQIGSFDFLGDIDATLNLYESEGLVRVISAPRIVTLNGIPANIEQTTELPFKKTDTTSAGVTETVNFKPLTLKLEVSPQITADGSVVMAVKVTREFPGADAGGGNFPVNRRQAGTTLLVRNGQTTVMGGIYQSDVTEGETGVPFLRKLPIFGALFRSRSITKDKNELMIFMTPRILNKERAFKSTAKDAS